MRKSALAGRRYVTNLLQSAKHEDTLRQPNALKRHLHFLQLMRGNAPLET